MESAEKPLKFTRHALQSMAKRGASQEDVAQAIAESPWAAARGDRFECSKDFPYNGVWHEKQYRTKQVVPVFKEEAGAIVIITVYVFYF
jgi:hypothetical protein|tara:strand:- start:535 stop:801 length:267 start_codon:yes stop_codon:yes gene_type:complete